MSVFAPTTNIVVLGTGPGERWSGKDEIRSADAEIIKDFDKGTATRDCYWKPVKSVLRGLQSIVLAGGKSGRRSIARALQAHFGCVAERQSY